MVLNYILVGCRCDITGVFLFQVSICKTLEGDELDHLALQGNKGQLDQKDQKVKRVNGQEIKEKNENCIGESLFTLFASLACTLHSL